MKSVAIFALTCLSAVVLTACGGGGGGGGGISVRPQPMQGDTLGGVVGSSGVVRASVAAQLNSLNGGRTGVTDPNSDLLMSQSDNGTVSFRTIRNSANYLSAPAIAIYTVSAGASAAVVDSVMTFGDLLGTSQVLMIGGSSVTVGLEGSNELRLGDTALSVTGNFRVRAFESSVSAPPSTSQSGASQLGVSPPDTLETGGSMMGISRYTYFLDGRYAALCLGFDVLNPLVYTWGGSIPTPSTNRTSTSGDLTYNIPYAMGAYTDGMNDQRFLNGSGTMSANLGSSGGVTLNLDVVDHNGSMFLDVDNLAMTLHNDRSGFRCSNGCAGSIDYADGVDLPDNTSTGFDSNGSFYGPNGQEVVGLISHIASSTVRMQLGFIGRDATQPPAPPPSPAPSPSPIPGVGILSPLPANAYTVVSGTTQINTDALFNYYSTLHGGSVRVTGNNLEFFGISADNGTTYDNGNENGYLVLQNPPTGFSNGLVIPPTFVVYVVTTGATVASGIRVVVPGPQFSVGQQGVLTLGSVQLTIVAGDANLTVGGREFIDLGGSGYTGSAHDTSATHANYAFFVEAEYSALYADLHRSPMSVSTGPSSSDIDLVGSVWSYGALTPQGNLPTSGNVTYNIDHVIGAYTDAANYANSKLLNGSGTLMADFTSGNRMVTLNLDVNDHMGMDFLDVTNLGMSIDADRNEFHCSYSPISNPSPTCSGGSIDYAAGVNLQDITGPSNIPSSDSYNARGAFYGPNAEEIAGGMSQSASGAYMELGFIGKRQLGPTTSDIPTGSATPATE